MRNAIVHNVKIGGQAIAEPHDEVTQRIVELFQHISNPKKVIPEFKYQVLSAKEDDYINDILIEMKNRSISQIPVFNKDNQIVEVINTNTISRWLTTQLEAKGTIMIEKVRVKDLLSEIEFKENYRFVSRNTNTYEAYDLFLQQIKTKKRNLDVLFITDSGKKTEKILALITIEDVARLI